MNGTHDNPIHMRIVAEKPPIGKLVIVGLFTLAPVAIAILMQNSSLRQAIHMRVWFTARKMSHSGAEWWRRMETIADHHYDIARL
jgi:hypothetical protein